MPRLGIVRCAYDVAFQILLEDLGVAALHPRGHCLAHEWERLMTIETAQLNDFAVEGKSLIGKLRLAKSKPP